MALLEDQPGHSERRRGGEQVHENGRRGGHRCAHDEQQQREAHRDHQAVDERQPVSERALEIVALGGRAADQRAVRHLRSHAFHDVRLGGDGTHARQREAVAPLGRRHRRNARALLKRGAHASGLVRRSHHLQFGGRPRSKGVLKSLVTRSRAGVSGQDADRRHGRAQAKPHEGECDEHGERRSADHQRAAPQQPSPARERLAAVLHGARPRQREAVDAGSEARQQRRQQSERRGQHEAHREQDPESARAERLARHDHHGGQRGQHGDAADQDRPTGAVHRLGDGVIGAQPRTHGGPKANHDEERVIDPHREREHQREVHGPDRDADDVRSQPQRPGRRDQAQDGQEQRDPGGGERAERDGEHGQSHRPGHHLGTQHRVLVLLVELRPEAGRAGERHLGIRACGRPEAASEAAGRPDHLGWTGGRTAAHDRDSSVGRDRPGAPGRQHRAHGRVAPQETHHSGHGRAESRAGAVPCVRSHDRGQRVAALAVEVPVDQPTGMHGLGAIGLPAATRERVLRARSERS